MPWRAQYLGQQMAQVREVPPHGSPIRNLIRRLQALGNVQRYTAGMGLPV
ncbi:MAG TPA: hypothetical protein VHN13_20185 [Candidatus Tectomicrobia bacterium]|jgi:hypothetical protein|nr:hypothetical protein [Candidatus Tectomicrobia bacterium]